MAVGRVIPIFRAAVLGASSLVSLSLLLYSRLMVCNRTDIDIPDRRARPLGALDHDHVRSERFRCCTRCGRVRCGGCCSQFAFCRSLVRLPPFLFLWAKANAHIIQLGNEPIHARLVLQLEHHRTTHPRIHPYPMAC